MKAEEFMESKSIFTGEVALTEVIWDVMAKIMKEPMEKALETGEKYQCVSEEQVEDLNICMNDLIKYYTDISEKTEVMAEYVKQMKKEVNDSLIRITSAEIYESND